MSGLNLGFRFIKILDIGYVTVIYFLLAIIIGGILDKLYGEYNDKNEKKHSTFRNLLDLIVMIWINGIMIYFARNLVQFIPSPFDNIYGFKHNRLKELESAYVFDFVLIYTQKTLIERMTNLYTIIRNFIFKK